MDPQTGLPQGAWDSHVHIVDESRFPLAKDHAFRPRKSDLNDLIAFEKSLSIPHFCLVAISVYGEDNRLLLDGLSRLGGKGRGVVTINPTTITDSELQEMHRLGVRAIRHNLHTTSGQLDQEGFGKILKQYAERIRPFGWAIQLFVALSQIPLIAPHIPDLGVPVIFDHLAHPEPSLSPSLQPGYTEFMDLLRSGLVWTKLSGTYRFSTLPDMDQYVQAILNAAPDRVVWASDWPHCAGPAFNPGGDPDQLQDYLDIDNAAFIKQCKKWCRGDESLIKKIFVDNPRRLWHYDESD